jgi:hypothetical protein
MLTYGFEAAILAHFDGDHRHLDTEDPSNERQREIVLDHGEKSARLFLLIIAVDDGFLDQLVQLRWRGDRALGNLSFGHAVSSPKPGNERK